MQHGLRVELLEVAQGHKLALREPAPRQIHAAERAAQFQHYFQNLERLQATRGIAMEIQHTRQLS